MLPVAYKHQRVRKNQCHWQRVKPRNSELTWPEIKGWNDRGYPQNSTIDQVDRRPWKNRSPTKKNTSLHRFLTSRTWFQKETASLFWCHEKWQLEIHANIFQPKFSCQHLVPPSNIFIRNDELYIRLSSPSQNQDFRDSTRILLYFYLSDLWNLKNPNHRFLCLGWSHCHLMVWGPGGLGATFGLEFWG